MYAGEVPSRPRATPSTGKPPPTPPGGGTDIQLIISSPDQQPTATTFSSVQHRRAPTPSQHHSFDTNTYRGFDTTSRGFATTSTHHGFDRTSCGFDTASRHDSGTTSPQGFTTTQNSQQGRKPTNTDDLVHSKSVDNLYRHQDLIQTDRQEEGRLASLNVGNATLLNTAAGHSITQNVPSHSVGHVISHGDDRAGPAVPSPIGGQLTSQRAGGQVTSPGQIPSQQWSSAHHTHQAGPGKIDSDLENISLSVTRHALE